MPSQAVPWKYRVQFHQHPVAMLAGLEHLDERYIKAVGYATKAKRAGRPKMVLIGDIVGDDEHAVAATASQVVRIAYQAQ